MRRGRINLSLALTAATLALAACTRPAWTDPARSRDQRELPDPTPAVPLDAGPVPSPPPWATGLIGRRLRSVFHKTGVCIGEAGRVERRFQGPPAGVSVSGWGWDGQARAPVTRVLLVDKDLRIVGAGVGGLARPAEPDADPRSRGAGWRADAPRTSGALKVFALTDAGAICLLDQASL